MSVTYSVRAAAMLENRSLQSLAVMSLVLAIGCTPSGSLRQQAAGDVLLISVDTLRADHLGAYGYRRNTSPNLDRWFAKGRVYERSYSTTAYTSPSVVSLLSGLLPQDHGVRLFDQLVSQHTPLLTQLLPPAYQTAAFVSNWVLSDGALGVGSRFDHYEDGLGPDAAFDAADYRAAAITDAALQWMSEHREEGRPLFLWVHYMDPHAPYRAPDEWRRSFGHAGSLEIPAGRVPRVVQQPGVTDALDYVDAYDEEIAYTDAEIGRLLNGYAKEREVDDALVIFTADHGESLVERGLWFGHMWSVFEEMVRVPLLMRGPGVAQGRSRSLVSGVDVTPTILAFANADIPKGLPGRDLRSTAGDAGDRRVFVETSIRFSHLRGVIQGHQKWVAKLQSGNPEIRSRKRFDLANDPGERRPTAWQDEAAPKLLLELIASDPNPGGPPADFERGHLRTESAEALRKLGYVE
jgi:arylsulfatase A-like enzyme